MRQRHGLFSSQPQAGVDWLFPASLMRSCLAQGAMAGLADLHPDACGERGGQAEPRAEHAEDQRIAALYQLDAASHAHTEHLEALRFRVVGFDAPHDGANARRQRVEANQLFGAWSIVVTACAK